MVKKATDIAAFWRVGMLVLVTALVWAIHYERWTLAQWSMPTDYIGDAHEMLARIKAASEGDTLPLSPQVIQRLAAPFGAHWNAYPTPDKPLVLFLGLLANVIGLFAAANVGLLLAQITAALAFYFAARWLKYRWEWAWVGALLFSYTYHTFHRGLPHFSFVFTWTIPLGLLAVWLIAQSRRLEWGTPGAIVCIAAGVALGAGNPYHLLFWGQLLGWSLVAQWFGARRRANLAIGMTAGVVALAAFFVTNAEIWLYVQEREAVPLLTRNYGGTERYALKPIEMFIPSRYHRVDFLAFFGHRYQRWSEWRGEDYIAYLGLFGIAGLIWLVAATARRLFIRRAPPGQALPFAWLVSYSTVGGLTNVVALFLGFQVFRATSRVAIWLSAIVLFFLVGRLARLTASWSPPLRLLAAMTVAAIGVLDQVPRRWPEANRARIVSEVTSDLALARELEAALPDGAMVFQLPVLGFPEISPPYRLNDYEHFRPYLASSTLRFSYGAAKYRSRSRWQRDLENLPVQTLVRRLESYGFAALYLNRKGYEDSADKLLEELREMGYTRRLQGAAGNQVVVLLNPASKPVFPLGRALTYGRGWYLRTDNGVRWANDDSTLGYFNPYDRPIKADIQLTLVAVAPRDIAVDLNGRTLQRVPVGEEPVILRLLAIELAPGVNEFKLRSSQPALRLGTGRYQLRSYGLQGSTIEITSERNGAE